MQADGRKWSSNDYATIEAEHKFGELLATNRRQFSAVAAGANISSWGLFLVTLNCITVSGQMINEDERFIEI